MDINMVSVIIPVYNAEHTVETAIRSVMAQTYRNVEIIMVDDGSTDGSPEICDRLAHEINDSSNDGKNHIIAHVIHEANSGVSYARNEGLKLVSGKYVAFADADDQILPDCIEKLVMAAKSAQGCSGRRKDLNPKSVKDSDGQGKEATPVAIVDMTNAIRSEKPVSGHYYIENAILNSDTHVWGKLFLTEAIKESMAKFPNGLTIGEDMLFLLRIALFIGNKERIRCIFEGGYIYNDNDEGAMKKAFSPSYMDQITCWEIAEKELAVKSDSLSPFIFTKLSGIMLMAAMLVVGKLACATKVDGESPSGINNDMEKEKYSEYIKKCRTAIQHALKRNGAFASLSIGYKAKIILFMISSKTYLKAYGNWKI